MATVAARPRLRVGIVKMASCDGCQLTLLDLEDELLALAQRFEIVEFPEASSLRSAGPFDVLLIEGSISTPDQARACTVHGCFMRQKPRQVSPRGVKITSTIAANRML